MLGRFLFRWRGVIGVLAFGVVFWLARPTLGSCLLGVPLLVAGLAVRFWASGYIGIEGRVREIGGRREERGVRREEGGTSRRRIVTGPYRILRHPLYIGNFMLVAGMLVALRPTAWLSVVVLAGFIVEYTLIVVAEERQLASMGPTDRSQKSEGRRQKAEVLVESPESPGEKPGTVNGENRVQSLRAPASDSARYSPRFPRPCEGTVPVSCQRPESFLLSRALVEWRTWVVTGAAWGLAMVKALLVMS